MTTETRKGKKRRILIVDDEHNVNTILKKVFEQNDSMLTLMMILFWH